MATRKEIIDRIGIGFFVGVLPFVLFLPVSYLFVSAIDALTLQQMFLCLGATAWVSLLPGVLFAKFRGKLELAKGLLLAGGILFLLGSACWAVASMAGEGVGTI